MKEFTIEDWMKDQSQVIVNKNGEEVDVQGKTLAWLLAHTLYFKEESEDERIRKFIAETVFRYYGDSQEYLDVLAYLEKQKESELLNNGEYHTVKVEILDRLYAHEKELEQLKKEQKPSEQLSGTFTYYDMAKTFTEGQNYVIAHPEKFGLCKPIECGGDERIRKWLYNYISNCPNNNFAFYGGVGKDAVLNYLEKQKDILGKRAQNITANMLEDGIEGIQRELIEFLSNTINASWVDIIRSADSYAERIRNITGKQKDNKFAPRVLPCSAAWFEDGEEQQKEQKPAEKQDYSGLNELERAILRGFLAAGAENVPVEIIKETAKECLAQIKPAEWSGDYREEDIQTRFAFYTYKDDPSVLYLSNVFVEKTSRNHGFGTRILKAAEKVAETIGAITICLKVKQDSPANAWYRKRGYGYVTFEDGYDWLEKNLEYLKPAKSAEWSEEDEKMVGTIISDGSRGVELDSKQVAWLKSLRPQSSSQSSTSHTVWHNASEEKPIKLPIIHIWYHGNRVCAVTHEDTCLQRELNDINFQPDDKWAYVEDLLNVQPHWRPREEQMKALEDAKMRMSLEGYGLCPLLQTLINDLESL